MDRNTAVFWTPGAAVVLENANGIFQPARPAYVGERITRGFADLNGDGYNDFLNANISRFEVNAYVRECGCGYGCG